MDAISQLTKGFICVAQISKTKGYDGTIICDIEEHYLSDLKNAPGIFAIHKGSLIPYFLDTSKSNLKDGFLKFDTINDKEYWVDISPRQLFLAERDIKDIRPQSQADSFVGWSLFNEEENIGIIASIEEYPQQIMLIVKNDSKSFLIPFHQEFIMDISEIAQSITLQLPEGLLDL